MTGMKRLLGVILVGALVTGLNFRGSWLQAEIALEVNGPKTVGQRVTQYGTIVDQRLKPAFAAAGIVYPPAELTLVILKQERIMELYAAGKHGDLLHYIKSYPILAASGRLGPKLQQGDDQVPEGIYAVDSLNPNSHYHLALHVDYPNAFDRAQARTDGRTQLGGDIMIHGNAVSIGCVAMGDPASEDLFVLAARTGLPQVRLLFCPLDFRLTKADPDGPDLPTWTPQLYATLAQALATLPLPPAATTSSSPP